MLTLKKSSKLLESFIVNSRFNYSNFKPKSLPDKKPFWTRNKKMVLGGLIMGYAIYKGKSYYELIEFMAPDWEDMRISPKLQTIISQYGKESPEVVHQLQNEAKILLNEGKIQESKEKLNLALKIVMNKENDSDINKTQLSEIFLNLFKIFRLIGKTEAAKFALTNLLSIGNADPDVKIEAIETELFMNKLDSPYDNVKIENLIEKIKGIGNTNDITLARVFLRIALYYSALENIKKSDEFFRRALEIINKNVIVDEKKRFDIYVLISDYYSLKNSFKEAINWRKKAIDMVNAKDDVSKVMAYDSLGELYSKVEDYQNALENYKLSLKYLKEIGASTEGIEQKYMAIAECAMNLGDKSQAIESFTNANEYFEKIGDKIRSLEFQFEACRLIYKVNKQEGISCLKQVQNLSSNTLGSFHKTTTAIEGYIDYIK